MRVYIATILEHLMLQRIPPGLASCIQVTIK